MDYIMSLILNMIIQYGGFINYLFTIYTCCASFFMLMFINKNLKKPPLITVLSSQVQTIKRLIVLLFQQALCLTPYNGFHQKEWLPLKGMHKVQVFQSPGFSGSSLFRVQVFQDPGYSGSRFFRVRAQGPVQVLEVALQELQLEVQGYKYSCHF